jgi:CRP/FNR family transcriptional regulator, nitrogen fixation regulation protein
MISKTATPDVMSIQAQSHNPSFEDIGVVRSYARKREIIGEDNPASHVYEVISGTVCTCKMLREGRRQIAGFYFAGDMFGLESAKNYSVAAEAITNAEVRIIKKPALTALASSNREVADRLLALATRELARKQALVLILSRNAEERIICFLIEMVQRASPREDDVVDLPMSRRDIADYLGLTIETVSRVLWDFSGAALSKSRAAIPLCCAISLRMEEAKGWLNVSRGLRVDGQRQKKNCRNGLSLSKARLLRYLNSRLCLAGAR